MWFTKIGSVSVLSRWSPLQRQTMKSIVLIICIAVVGLGMMKAASADQRMPSSKRSPWPSFHSHSHRSLPDTPLAQRQRPRPAFGTDMDTTNGTSREMEIGDLHLRILGRSGAIALGKVVCRNESDPMSCRPKKAIVLKPEEIIERDDGGNIIGVGKAGHSFKNFAQQDFTFTADKDAMIPNSNISARTISFQATLSESNSTVQMILYITKEDGEIDIDGEIQNVSKGMLKFSISLENWEWCGCTKGQNVEEGASVDFAFSVKSPRAPRRKTFPEAEMKGNSTARRRPRNWDLDESGSAQFLLSEKVQVDGVWQDMDADFPKMEARGAKTVFIFRFPRFNNSVFYDPTVASSDEDDTEEDTSNTTVTTVEGVTSNSTGEGDTTTSTISDEDTDEGDTSNTNESDASNTDESDASNIIIDDGVTIASTEDPEVSKAGTYSTINVVCIAWTALVGLVMARL